MSLQIWLPMNGTMNNQGINDMAFVYTNNNSALTVSSSGKFGKCYERTASAKADLYRSNSTINLNNDISMCCWAYVSETIGDTANGLVTNHSHTDNTGVGITVKQISTSDYRISCNTGTGSSRTYHTYYGTTNIKNSWHHLCLTYNKTAKQLRLWVDGKIEYTLNNYVNASKADYIDLFNWSTTYYTNGDFRPKCKLCDVRVYDNCLSTKEVREIAKGLILHYKLDNSGCGNPNLIKNSMSSPTGFNDYTAKAFASRIVSDGITATNIYSISFPTDSATYSNYNLYTTFTRDTEKAVQKDGKTYTLSFKVKANKVLSDYSFNYEYISTAKTITVTTEWQTVSITGTAVGAYGALYVCNGQANRNKINGGILYIADLKLEEGSKATSWCPYISDAEYTALGLNNNIESDCSGYGNDGTKIDTILSSSNSIRYESCYYIKNPKGSIQTPNILFENMSQGTLNIWINRHSTSSDWRIYTVFANGYNWTGNQSDFIILGSTGSQAITFDCCSNTYSVTPDLNKWYMYTITWDLVNHKTQYYWNGVLVKEVISDRIDTTYASKHTYHCFGNQLSTDVNDYSLSDARIYSTVLLAEDIKELYQTSASIDKDGNIFAYNLMEE